MNRDIKFRFWCKSEKRFISDPEIGKDGRVSVMDGISSSDDCTNDVEVMQYTGFKDKSGREIYEGDVLRIPDDEKGKDCVWEPYCHVWFSSFGTWTVSYNHQYSEVSSELGLVHHKYEVVGNVFENPNLIE